MVNKNRIITGILCLLLVSHVMVGIVTGDDGILDVSGIWKTKFSGIENGCKDSAGNKKREGSYTIIVIQQKESISGIFEDGNTTNIITGKVRANMIEIAVTGSKPDGCAVKTVLKGQIIGEDKIKGAYTGESLNCDTCKWQGMFSINIKK